MVKPENRLQLNRTTNPLYKLSRILLFLVCGCLLSITVISTEPLMRRHIVPNVFGPALVYATLTIPGVILAESFISFLGLGIQEPDTSWGVLIADGTQSMESAPWTLIFPGALLAMTIWCTNMLGDRLRDQMEAGAGYTRSSGAPEGGRRT